MGKLTDVAIKKAKQQAKDYMLTDGEGLYVWITHKGSKLWRWGYRFQGREKLISYGRYPDISLARARELHAEARKLLANGIDPMADRKQKRTAKTTAIARSFETIARRWFVHWSVDKSPRHANDTIHRLESNVFPVLGPKPIDQIEARDIVTLLSKIEERGAHDIAKRALQTIGQILRFAVARSIAQRNPVADIRPSDVLQPSKRVNFARVSEKELPDLLKAIEVYRGTHIVRLAMKLLALTFVRTSELIGARWEEIDFEARRWNIPAERMKMDTPHIVPLSTHAIEVLRNLQILSGDGDLIFPGDRNRSKPISNNAILKALQSLGYKGRMTGHGFRGVASTILHEQQYPHEHIELQLAHTKRDAVSAAYNHALHLTARAKMMQDWGDYLDNARRSETILSFKRKTA